MKGEEKEKEKTGTKTFTLASSEREATGDGLIKSCCAGLNITYILVWGLQMGLFKAKQDTS